MLPRRREQRQRTDRKEPLLACHTDFSWKAFLPGVVWPPRVSFGDWRLHSALRCALPPGGAIGTNVTAVDPFAFISTQVKLQSTGSGAQMVLQKTHAHQASLWLRRRRKKPLQIWIQFPQLSWLCSLPGGPHKETHLCQAFMLHVLFILLSFGFLMLQEQHGPVWSSHKCFAFEHSAPFSSQLHQLRCSKKQPWAEELSLRKQGAVFFSVFFLFKVIHWNLTHRCLCVTSKTNISL